MKSVFKGVFRNVRDAQYPGAARGSRESLRDRATAFKIYERYKLRSVFGKYLEKLNNL